ncbi:Mediator of RNA polymerase II transcription subunit 16-like [Heracleum sosnowskyi]|uniref:Mediator of RNA polymerase II transcription subunit 16-like n=1 Tax=Heracleum sosnowskyi TaxID=360622 RepID=A0AAD8MQT6_9APIA|nr:Mediator of RNA polymerase II transcription subunit 16-like [Heracleum sosnowskyi]
MQLHPSQLSRLLKLPHTFPPKFKPIYTTQTQSFSSSHPVLNLCNNPKHLLQIHARYILHGLIQNPTLCSKLIDSYTNLGLFKQAQQLFYSCTNPNSIVYNSLICNLYKFGELKKALVVYQEMMKKCVCLDENAYFFVLKCCFELCDVVNFEKIYVNVIKLGFDCFEFVNRGFDFGGSWNACNVTEEMTSGEVGFWNFLIFEACRRREFKESFRVFGRMRMGGVWPDSVTIVNLLRASCDLMSLEVGRMVHCVVCVSRLSDDLAVNTALLSFYSKMGCLEVARMLFDRIRGRDCVVWNLMISAYSRNGCLIESLELLMVMVRSGVRTDLFTALAAISSIGELKCIERGKEMHGHVIRNGLDYQVSVHNSLIDMYCKCGGLVSARMVFDLVTNKTMISWSSMIKGFVSHEQFSDAFSLFREMKLKGYRIDFITVINILPAFVSLGALEQLKYLHGYSTKCGLTSFASVTTAFLASYAKCGCIEMAQKLFEEDEFTHKDVIAWNSMIGAYSKHGNWLQCFNMYTQLKLTNLKPDQVTFLSVLTACVNSGSVDEGWECFREMTERYGCQPKEEHYACMVDLLGRTGRIKEALELINSMTFNPDARVWGPLLSACKLHPDMKVAELAAERLITMEPKNAGNYILLSNIYAAAGKWEEVARMRVFLRDRGLKKTPGCSWLDINGKNHEFRVADQSHPQSHDIYTILRNLELEIKKIMKKESSGSYYNDNI